MDISNEQKAREIAKYLNQPNGSNSLLECHQAAMAMAEWKDKQFEKEKQQWIDEACEWLFKNTKFTTNDIRDFKNAMKGE